jgi:two-component system chemotaxis response regulator CheB
LRVIGERVVLMEKMTLEAHQAGRTAAAATFESRAEEYQRHASVLMEAALKR